MILNIRARLLAGGALALMAAGAHAQTTTTAAQAKSDASVSEVVVTGSRIRGVAPVGSPVIALGRQDLQDNGPVTTAQFLLQSPQIYNLGTAETSRASAGGSNNITYGSGVNLRGIGPYSTLTLIEGHRVARAGNLGSTVDPSIIPTIALERIDVEADGASAIYGSDAVAGVVNLILRRNFEGVETNLRYGVGDSYDERQAGFIIGGRWEGGRATLAFENGYHSAIKGADRDFYRANQTDSGGTDYRLNQCNPGNIIIAGVSYAIPAGGITPATASQLKPNTVNRCDPLKTLDVLPRENHNTVMVTLNQELGDKVSLYGSLGGARRDYKFRGSSSTGNINNTLTVPATNAFFVTPVPGVTSEQVGYSFYPDLTESNYNVGYSKSWQATVGADIRLAHDWKLGLLEHYSRDDDQAHSPQVDFARLNQALASSNPATAFNPFGGTQNAALLSTFRTSQYLGKGRNTEQQTQVRMDGPVFEIPGGAVRAALGAESLKTTNIFTFITGPATNLAIKRQPLERTDNAVFGEIFVPLVGPNNAMPGIRRLDLSVAGRYEKYSDVGHTSNPKVGVSWSPAEGITARASYGTSFRAPNITDLSLELAGLGVNTFIDPKSPTGTSVGVSITGGNPNLKPETATTYTAGLDLEPPQIPGLRASVTYFRIDYENQIAQYLGDATVLQREALFTSIITRNPPASVTVPLIATHPLMGGALPPVITVLIDGTPQNLGSTLSEGFDFQISYRWETQGLGAFQIGTNGTYFDKYSFKITPAATPVNNLNHIYNPLRWRNRTTLRWNDGPFSVAGTLNYTNSYINDRTSPAQTVDAYATVDLHLAYRLGDLMGDAFERTTVSLDVTNLADKDPPYVNIPPTTSGGGGFDGSNASVVGRVIAIGLNARW